MPLTNTYYGAILFENVSECLFFDKVGQYTYKIGHVVPFVIEPAPVEHPYYIEPLNPRPYHVIQHAWPVAAKIICT